MGKGDIRSKKGKRFAGSYGNSRPKKSKVEEQKKQNKEEKK